jgi:hypothetical protein
MSGGSYQYKYYRLEELADDIERDFINDGKYMSEDWSGETNFITHKKPMIEHDRIGDTTDDERIVILKEIKSLIEDLRKCSMRSKHLEWYMSGDFGATSYLKRLKKDGLI